MAEGVSAYPAKPGPRPVLAMLKGTNARCRARLMAVASIRWCLAHTPVLRRDSILHWSEMNLLSVDTSL